jgi:hypothetical protein
MLETEGWRRGAREIAVLLGPGVQRLQRGGRSDLMWPMEIQSRANSRQSRRFEMSGRHRGAPRGCDSTWSAITAAPACKLPCTIRTAPTLTACAALACRVGYLGNYVDRGFDSKQLIILGRAEKVGRKGLGQLDAEVDQHQQQPRRQGSCAPAQPRPGGGASRA